MSASGGLSWSDVCMSSDGSKVIAIGDNNAYYMTGYSLTLSAATMQVPTNSVGISTVSKCAINEAGTVSLVLALEEENNWVLAMYVNDNTNSAYSPVFSNVNGLATSDVGCGDIFVDSTGNTIVVYCYTTFFISSDRGQSWVIRNLKYPEYFDVVTMSQYSNGDYMIGGISTFTTAFYVSANQGKTWTAKSVPLNIYQYPFYSVASSYSGLVATIGALSCDGKSRVIGSADDLVVIYCGAIYCPNCDANIR